MFSNITFFRKEGAGSIQSSSCLGSLCSCMLNNGLYGLLEGSHGHLKLSPSMLVWDPFRRHLTYTINLKREKDKKCNTD